MEVLWEKGTATVADVVESLAEASKGSPPAYSTVLTMLRILENNMSGIRSRGGRLSIGRSRQPDGAEERDQAFAAAVLQGLP